MAVAPKGIPSVAARIVQSQEEGVVEFPPCVALWLPSFFGNG